MKERERETFLAVFWKPPLSNPIYKPFNIMSQFDTSLFCKIAACLAPLSRLVDSMNGIQVCNDPFSSNSSLSAWVYYTHIDSVQSITHPPVYCFSTAVCVCVQIDDNRCATEKDLISWQCMLHTVCIVLPIRMQPPRP